MSKNDIKYYSKLKQKKFRDSEGSFLIEGKNLIDECLRSNRYKRSLLKIFVRNDYSDSNFISEIKQSNPHTEIIHTNSKDFNSLSETVNSQGIIGIVKKPVLSEKDFIPEGNISVLLDAVNDPGNLGTILRTCYWFNVNEVILGEDSADVYNSKVLRASQGAIFHLNIKSNLNAIEITEEYYKNNFTVLLTDLKSEKYVSEMLFSDTENYLLVFGNESNGIKQSIISNKNYKKIKIKGFSECESLNLSVSAGILLDRIRNFKQ